MSYHTAPTPPSSGTPLPSGSGGTTPGSVSNSSLIKEILHKSLAEAVYKDLVTRSSNYYYFLGKTLEWADDFNPPYPVDSLAYEKAVRREIITLKKINPSDVSFVIPRRNWQAETIYDMFDDEYSNEILGIDVVDGGFEYSSLPTIAISGGGGSGASFSAIVQDGKIIGVDTISKGDGYGSVPTVTLSGGGGSGAVLRAVINKPFSGATKLENSTFYVMTDDFNVYKCLDNNGNSRSTNKPLGTDINPIVAADGYIWKYMYNVPINLRNKFLTESQIPVVSALTNQFYSNGSLESISISNRGRDYTFAAVTVVGDGYREGEQIFLLSVNISNAGANYFNPTVTISDPVPDAFSFISEAGVFLGQYIYNDQFDFYEVVTPGSFSTTQPTHRFGIVQNGTAALKFVGTRARATATVTGAPVSNIIVTAGGSGYTVDGTSVTISAPELVGGITATAVVAVDGSGTITNISVLEAGSGYLNAPTVDIVGDGSLAEATSILGDSTVSAINFIGAVREVDIINPGKGYIKPPTVTFVGGGGSGATAIPKMETGAGSVLFTTITNSGDNYTTNPDVVFGDIWTGTTAVLVNEQYFFSNRLYTVVTDGTTGSEEPSHTIRTINAVDINAGFLCTIVSTGTSDFTLIGAESNTVGVTFTATGSTTGNGTVSTPSDINGTAVLDFVGFPATGSVVRRFGTGYNEVPTILVTDPGSTEPAQANISFVKSEAKLIPILADGQIDSIVIENPGVGYSTAVLTVTGDGVGASLLADLSIGNIESLQANNELLTAPGTINAIKVISGGYGYGAASVFIEGDGTGAQATIAIDPSTGRISKISIVKQGFGYTFANITITGNGFAASARAIISPYDGHGKNSPDELFARTLLFYSNVSTDLNQGLIVNNDYRQLGIIKNPNVYKSKEKFQQSLGSGCFVVGTLLNPDFFPGDTDVTTTRLINDVVYTKRYRVVSVTPSTALLQSIDNDEPQINDIFENSTGQAFTIFSVGFPTVDKYSGQMMFIDNKAGFTPSAEETVTLTTVIRF